MLLNNNELAAVKDCLKRYIEFNNNRLMSSYKVKKEFNLIKEVINERIKLDDIGPAVRLVTLYNCLRNGIYVTCSIYDEFKSLEDENGVDR